MGGGISIGDDSDPIIRACVFVGNAATTGGGIASSNGRGRVIDCTFTGNSAQSGGGAGATNLARPEFEDCSFQANEAATGGAAYAEWAFPLFRHCRFRENAATDAGGAVGARILAELQLDGCTLDGNQAAKSGGGVGLFGGAAAIFTSCTFHANRAPSGGGIAVYSAASAELDRCILEGSFAGGAVHCAGGTMALDCCDLYGNAGGDYTGCIAGLEGLAGNFSADPLFCDPAAGDLSLRGDSPCLPGSQPSCGLIGALPAGCAAMEIAGDAPAAAPILAASPNPFRRAVAFWIAPGGLDVGGEICVFDAAGRRVRRLPLPRASGSMIWDGRDSSGREVPAGVYYIRVLGGPGAGAGAGGRGTIGPKESGWGSVRAEAKVVRLR